ncbi:MAG TPA: N-6 DNA methylase, partial [Agitococcus sp.]|nr:N-6 DNA methylase [Agitococcus sp.]
GRAAVIVPDGVLFGSSNAHQQLREELIERNQLEAIISLPSGVFKPYAGVSTAIVLFTKGGQTDQVLFYDLANDGFSLDDKRTPITLNDLPDAVSQWRNYQQLILNNDHPQIEQQFADKTQKAFVVTKADIAAQKYDLSINRYKEVVYAEQSYAPPKEILQQLKSLEEEILQDLLELENML